MSISKIKKIINMLLESEMQSSDNVSLDEPYGKILFSPQRLDNVDKSEPNTTLEDELRFALKRHYQQIGSVPLAKNVPEILNLIDQGKYNEILKPAPGYVYRILSNLESEIAAKLIGVSEEELVANASDRPWILEKPTQLNPKNTSYSSLQSWSYNLLKLDFGSFRINTVELIFEAPVEGNVFFMNPRTAEKVSFLSNYNNEYETISVGKVNCSRILVYYNITKKTTINTELLKKYITLINKKGHELEKIINKEIMDFYHENGLFLNITDMPKFGREESNIIQDLYDKDLTRKYEVKLFNDFKIFFSQLLTKLVPMLKRDFGPDYEKITYYLGFQQPLNYFSGTGTNFLHGGFIFKEINTKWLIDNIMDGEFIANKNGVGNILFRAFQRKQKY